jgi:hypothetical protein
MKQHERDYFVSTIRTGKYRIEVFGKTLEILSPTIDDEYYINKAFIDGFNSAVNDGFKTNDEMVEWMIERDLWSHHEEKDLENIVEKIKENKIAIYHAKNNKKLKDSTRITIRNLELQLQKLNDKKTIYYNNTCEGIATVEKISEHLKRCSYSNGEKYDFDELPVDFISNKYYSMFLSESKIRELARTEPWRTLWQLNSSETFKLFSNNGRELSHDQKNLLVWSTMYDNVQESMDCPTEDVINDDDMLDGWFLIQTKKRKEEKSSNELDNMNPKIANSQEVYIMANSQEDRQRIDNLNSREANFIKKQRSDIIKQKGDASQLDFQDEKLKMGRQQTEGIRRQFRR